MRKLLTPGIRVVVAAVATSAKPSATGRVPKLGPTAEQASNAPERSAKLITIEGVPEVNWLGAGNNPWVNWSKLTGPATKDADTAAYNTLQGPVDRATMSPNKVDEPPP